MDRQWTIYLALPDDGGTARAAGVTTALYALRDLGLAGTVTPSHGYTPEDGFEQGLVVTVVGDASRATMVHQLAANLTFEFSQRGALVTETTLTSAVSVEVDDYEDEEY